MFYFACVCLLEVVALDEANRFTFCYTALYRRLSPCTQISPKIPRLHLSRLWRSHYYRSRYVLATSRGDFSSSTFCSGCDICSKLSRWVKRNVGLRNNRTPQWHPPLRCSSRFSIYWFASRDTHTKLQCASQSAHGFWCARLLIR